MFFYKNERNNDAIHLNEAVCEVLESWRVIAVESQKNIS